MWRPKLICSIAIVPTPALPCPALRPPWSCLPELYYDSGGGEWNWIGTTECKGRRLKPEMALGNRYYPCWRNLYVGKTVQGRRLCLTYLNWVSVYLGVVSGMQPSMHGWQGQMWEGGTQDNVTYGWALRVWKSNYWTNIMTLSGTSCRQKHKKQSKAESKEIMV